MIIAVELDKRAEFDALWNWSKSYLYISETNHPSFGFFAWQARTNGRLAHTRAFCSTSIAPLALASASASGNFFGLTR